MTDDFPAGCETLEIRLGEARQLFLSIDAAPFRERDLDPRAEEFIVGWAREQRHDRALGVEIHLERPSPKGDDASVLPEAVAEYFRGRAQAIRCAGKLEAHIQGACVGSGLELAGFARRITAGSVSA